MTRIGYARVSTADQSTDLQDDALNAAGCTRIFSEHVSGALSSRPELDACLAYLREGDTLVIWKIDRLGRSLRHLLDIVAGLDERGVGLHSIQDGFDTNTASGRLLFSVVGALGEFERTLVVERTRAGLEAARARGRVGGRPKVMTPSKTTAAKAMHADGTSPGDIAEALGVSRATIYRTLRESSPVSQ